MPDSGDLASFKIALVTMPFSSAVTPSIQLGLLTAIARRAGFESECHYLNLDLAAEMGVDVYERFCEHRGHMTGEWLFARSAFGDDATSSDAYVPRFPSERSWAVSITDDAKILERLRDQVLPAYIDRCASSIPWGNYDVVGFTVTFQQTVASLALARRIKESHAHVRILFGGANVDSPMGREVMRGFDWIDFVISGEADDSFPALLLALAAGQSEIELPGVLSRRGDLGEIQELPGSPFEAMDSLPTPIYDEYFEAIERLGLRERVASKVSLPFEGARGCWWGVRRHCTFCGLNGQSMAFRSKTPNRLMDELRTLSGKHAMTDFQAVDNIMDRSYIGAVFPRLADARVDYHFFYESKANLQRDDLKKLALGGVRTLQPGIESMSTRVLRLMRKGSTMLQNVLCLKWCAYYQIGVAWNLLYGFPGETEDDYMGQLRVLKAIGHLEPPNAFGKIWLERFSPHFSDSAAFGLRNVRPSASYEEVFPSHINLNEIAYFFDYDDPTISCQEEAPDSEVMDATREWVAQWRDEWTSDGRRTLTFRLTPDCVMIDRVGADLSNPRTITLTGLTAEMLLFCSDRVRGTESMKKHLDGLSGMAYSDADVRDTLEEFCQAGLMVGEGERYLSLPIPANPNW